MSGRTMRRFAAAGIAALALAQAVPALAAGGAAPAKPKLVFKETVWDFGKIKQGAEVSHDFVFKNEGDDDLTIKGVETSCGCTAALISDKRIGPGKSGKVKVTFDSRGYAGEVTKYINVESNDPAAPGLQLKITAAVDVPPQPRIDLDRYSYEAGLLVEGDPLESEVLIRNRGELELKVECSLANATFRVDGKPAPASIRVPAGKEVRVVMTLPLEARVGLVREFVLFRSNDPLRSTISMTVSGYIVTRDELKKLFEKYKDVIK